MRSKRKPSHARGSGAVAKRNPQSGAVKKDIIPKDQRLVMGVHSVSEALRVRPHAVRRMWLRQNFHDNSELQEFAHLAEKHRIPVEMKSPEILNRMTSGHQGLGVLVDESPELDWEGLKSKDPQQLLILDGVEDPHNLGAILRTAWLLGVKAIFIPEVRAAGLSPTTCKVASGGAEHVPIVYESSLPQLVERLKALDFWVYGLAADGGQDLWSLQLEGKVVWALGSEEKGLRKPLSRSCDQLVKIHQCSSQASFNVSVAAALAMGESARQLGHLHST